MSKLFSNLATNQYVKNLAQKGVVSVGTELTEGLGHAA